MGGDNLMLTQEMFFLIRKTEKEKVNISDLQCRDSLSKYLKEELLKVQGKEHLKKEEEKMESFIPYFYRKGGQNNE